ncbi:MAG: hypothetical protein P8N43_11935 [Alphaproteobacteria bacterium]|nr:hypothetical protein [Alphaproteobacteria bacterium]
MADQVLIVALMAIRASAAFILGVTMVDRLSTATPGMDRSGKSPDLDLAYELCFTTNLDSIAAPIPGPIHSITP